MQVFDRVLSNGQVAPGGSVVQRVLVVDDSKMQRRILVASLARAGYDVIEAASGEEALAICERDAPDLILSDWMMPGMTGPEFCAAFRQLKHRAYGYFILLTSKTEKNEIAHGLAAGADDFLTKPVNGEELRARILAGDRILRMERELTQKNALVLETLRELQSVYQTIDLDLIEARKLQQSLVRDRHRSFCGSDVSLLLRPSGHVGGDLVGFFPINDHCAGLFAIDVSGHGITSALMTARLAGYLSGSAPDHNIALAQGASGQIEGRSPSDIAAHLNRIIFDEMQSDSYLTLAYADIDLRTGMVRVVQAGHPFPVVQRASGDVEFHGAGGLPVGLIETAVYDEFRLTLRPGDRLFLVSDGITEAEDCAGNQLGEDGLAQLMRDHAHLGGRQFLDALQCRLDEFTTGEAVDDVSAVLFEYRRPGQAD